jgi:hypothetical protein
MKKLMLWSVVLFLTACGMVSTQPRPGSYAVEQPVLQNPENQGSLLTGDNAVISDAEIQKILSYKVAFPVQMRIAILPLGQQQSWWTRWSADLTQLSDQIEQQFITVLRASPAIYDASYLPSFLVPEKRSVPYLREAAARYQADILFIYRPTCTSYEKYRLLSADETKAYCTVEAAVLDTRSGIVPFTSVATETFSAQKEKEDLDFSETLYKAQMKATGDALAHIAKDLVKFIEASRHE